MARGACGEPLLGMQLRSVLWSFSPNQKSIPLISGGVTFAASLLLDAWLSCVQGPGVIILSVQCDCLS